MKNLILTLTLAAIAAGGLSAQNNSGAPLDPPKKLAVTFVIEDPETPIPNARTYVEAIDIKDKSMQVVIKGLTTHQLEGVRKYMYWQTEEVEPEIADVANAYVDTIQYIPIMQAPGVVTKPNFPEAEIVEDAPYTGKEYRITNKGDYQYKDNKVLVGTEKQKAKAGDGFKSITQITFYYEIHDLEMINRLVTLKEFLLLTSVEQIEMIKEHDLAKNPVDPWLQYFSKQLNTDFIEVEVVEEIEVVEEK